MESAPMIVVLLAVVFAILIIVTKLRDRNISDSDPKEGPRAFQSHPAGAAIAPPREPAKLSALLPPQFVVLDLETTGLNPMSDEIIEFGAIRVTLDAENHEAFQCFVKPSLKVPQKITRITGITQEMIDQNGLPLQDALHQFVEFIGDLPLVTFNAEFDIGFIQSAARKHGFTIANRYTCALKRARRAWPGLPSYKLADLAKLGRLPDTDTHRAVGDCTRALIVFTSATSALGQKVRWTKPSA